MGNGWWLRRIYKIVAKRHLINSPIGERQMFPWQTNKMCVIDFLIYEGFPLRRGELIQFVGAKILSFRPYDSKSVGADGVEIGLVFEMAVPFAADIRFYVKVLGLSVIKGYGEAVIVIRYNRNGSRSWHGKFPFKKQFSFLTS